MIKLAYFVKSAAVIASVTGIENLAGTYKGNYGEMALRFLNVFVRREGRWQWVVHQSTPVPKK